MIEIFGFTSQSLDAYFRLAQLLGYQRALTGIIPSGGPTDEDGRRTFRVGIVNQKQSPLKVAQATFIFRQQDHGSTDLCQVDFKVESPFGLFGESSTGEWERSLRATYPFNYMDPYFFPPEVSLGDFREMFGPDGGRARALKHYFLTGRLPVRE